MSRLVADATQHQETLAAGPAADSGTDLLLQQALVSVGVVAIGPAAPAPPDHHTSLVPSDSPSRPGRNRPPRPDHAPPRPVSDGGVPGLPAPAIRYHGSGPETSSVRPPCSERAARSHELVVVRGGRS